MRILVPVPEAKLLEVGEMLAVKVRGKALLLFRTPKEFCATDRRCTHQAADLAKGYFQGTVIECPMHQGRFCVRTGKALSAPAALPLRTYAVSLVGGEVSVEIDEAESNGVAPHP